MQKRNTILRACAVGTLTLGLALLGLWSTGNFPPVALANSGGGVTYRTLTKCTPTGGTILNSPTGGTFVNNTVVTLTADPNPGYDFSAWTGSVSGSTNPINLTMNANKSICATFVADSTLPVITRTGDATVYVECGTPYTDAGATATDNRDGNITARIVVGGDTVEVDSPGTYTITYNVKDDAENSATQVTRTVIVQDTGIPVITLLGVSPMTVFQGVVYDEPGATALDDCEGDLTGDIVIGGSVNTATLGAYHVTYDVSDAASNDAVQQVRTVNVIVDNAPPVITLLGDDPLHLAYGEAYEEFGATALDNPDGDISAAIVVGGDTVDMNTLGTYEVTYDVEDEVGNDAVQVVRTVNVVDLTAPVITLVGLEVMRLTYGGVFTDPGATALDNVDGDLTVSIVVGGDTADTSVLGTYAVEYRATDAAGNEGITVRAVIVEDLVPPMITLLGDNPLTVAYQGTYSDPGTTASDNRDGDLTASIVVGGDTVDPNMPGSYSVTYDVSDSEGNAAVQEIRTVVVPTPVPQTLTVVGPVNGTIRVSPPDPALELQSGSSNHYENYDYGTALEIEAMPDPGYLFWEWGGDAAGAGGAFLAGDDFNDEVLNPVWTVYAGSWSESVGGQLEVVAGPNTAPAIRRAQIKGDLSIGFTYQRVSGIAPLRTILRWVDPSNFTALDIDASSIILRETVAGVEAVLGTVLVETKLGTWYALEIQLQGGTVTVWRAIEGGPAQFVLSTATSHLDTTAFEWGTGSDTAYALDDLEFRALAAQASLVMEADKTVSATFLPVDNTAPVITLLGGADIGVDCGQGFTDPGVTALDDRYGDISGDIVVGGDIVNDSVPGIYEITYDVMDHEGNAAPQVTRTVTVTSTDVSLPVIALNGDAVLYLSLNDTYTEPGATAQDMCDPSLPAVTVDNSAVNTAAYGEYTVTYNVTDNANNAAVQVTRTVRVWPTLTKAVSGDGSTAPTDGQAHFFAPDTLVNLSANAAPGSYFSGWTGDAVADPSAGTTTITVDGAKSVTAVFGAGFVVTLAVEGAGALHYDDNGVQATVTETGGPVAVIVDPASAVLAVEAVPDAGASDFWQWLSDDPTIDQTYVASSDFPIGGHTSITATFAPAGALEFQTVTLMAGEGGTTSPPPGDYLMPRFAGTDVACVQACQNDDDPLPGGCAPCEIASLQVEGVADTDWVFYEWHGGGQGTERYTDSPARIPIAYATVLTPHFIERPGLVTLDLVADYGAFLVEIGLHTAGASPYDLALDWGDVWIDSNGLLQSSGNGIPDVAEISVLQAILRDVHLNETRNHGVAHVHTWNDFRAN